MPPRRPNPQNPGAQNPAVPGRQPGQPPRRPQPPRSQPPGEPGAGQQRKPVPPPPKPVAKPTEAARAAAPDQLAAKPKSGPRRPAAKGANGSVGRKAGMVALAFASTVVLLLTGYGYATLDSLLSGLATDDVIKNGGEEKPADGAVDILLVGLDSRTDAHGDPLPRDVLNQLNAGGDDGELNTDTLILVHVPNDTSKPASLLSIPRDSYVDIPGGYGKHKINSAYARAMNDEMGNLQKQGGMDQKTMQQKAQSAGRKELIDTISKLTGATIDHYAEINLYGFSEITKAVGGVEVCLKAPAKDSFSGANFPAGKQSIQGVDALKFVRQRHGLPNGDLDRIKRQQVFMAGLAKTVLSAGTLTNPSKLSDLIGAIKNAVLLDAKWDLLGFAQQLKGMTGGGLHFQTIPTGRPDLETNEDGQAVEVIPSEVQAFVRKLTGDTPSSTSSAGQPSGTSATGGANADVTVEVRNANGTPGLADRVLNALAAKGFSKGNTDNSPKRAKSVIRYPSGGADNAKRVSEALGGGYTLEQDDANGIASGHVRIFLSTAYDGPGAQGFTGPQQYQLAPPATSSSAPAGDDGAITADGITCIN
ncbi:LCP family protein required for cell wall assembly [Kutzneria viridogrisea]|uniref:LCP family protein required for cell wall assembly n=1 Tax=Kutzneria viridogrisea TaxID=47990 RepID=A0ABR6BI42_9PSEU|nr:LCP family protein required for cell wall assembly [Kutzneria viridogrisea]